VTIESVQSDAPATKRFRFIAGNLALDFCNSVGGKRETIPRENLHSYADFLSWCEQAGLVGSAEVQRLKEQELRDPAHGVSTFGRARGLREAVYRVFYALAGGQQPSGVDMDILNAELALGLGRLRIAAAQQPGAFSWCWADVPLQLDCGLGPIAYSAAVLLASEAELARVRQCRADNCGWLFLDSSKNHSRCWCDMRDCGNRAKVRRHRQKLRHSDAAS